MKLKLAALAALLIAAPAMAQPIIIPLSKQQPQQGQQPPASPVPVAPPQADATPGARSQPGGQPSTAGSTAQGNAGPDDAGSGEGQPPTPAR
jgi:hypothetical protein